MQGGKAVFLVPEFHKTVRLLVARNSFDEIQRQSLEESTFGAPAQRRANQMCRAVMAASLGSNFYPVFPTGDLTTQKLLALVAVFASDTLRSSGKNSSSAVMNWGPMICGFSSDSSGCRMIACQVDRPERPTFRYLP